MKERKLKLWVKVVAYSIIGVTLIGSTIYFSKSLLSKTEVDNNSYVLRDIADDLLPVNSEVQKLIIKPYTDESVNVHINYYKNDDTKENQERSLILYENTYMPNTGILYGSEKEFNVIAVYDGEVLSIKKDEIFGNIVEIKHDNDIVSKYSSLKQVNVKEGDKVKSSDVIGISGENKIVSVSQNMLLFEIIDKGNNVNPEDYYNKAIKEEN